MLVLGGGSNLVVADAGFDGVVVRVAHRGIALRGADGEASSARRQRERFGTTSCWRRLPTGWPDSSACRESRAWPARRRFKTSARTARDLECRHRRARIRSRVERAWSMLLEQRNVISAIARARSRAVGRYVVLEVEIVLAAPSKSARFDTAAGRCTRCRARRHAAPTIDVRAAVLALARSEGHAGRSG